MTIQQCVSEISGSWSLSFALGAISFLVVKKLKQQRAGGEAKGAPSLTAVERVLTKHDYHKASTAKGRGAGADEERAALCLAVQCFGHAHGVVSTWVYVGHVVPRDDGAGAQRRRRRIVW